MTNLRLLSFESCNLTGTIPSEIGDMSGLIDYLNFAKNNLTGTIPTTIGNLSSLKSRKFSTINTLSFQK